MRGNVFERKNRARKCRRGNIMPESVVSRQNRSSQNRVIKSGIHSYCQPRDLTTEMSFVPANPSFYCPIF